MRFLIPSAAKLNLSLRVTSRRPDGYHEIVSLFARLPSLESLTVEPALNKDNVNARGLLLEGENIVSRALRRAREAGFDVPFFDIEIHKNLCPGSGLGAGSGNGAAILNFLSKRTDDTDWRKVALKTGADVPFLFSGHSLAMVSGVGECIEPLPRLPMEVFVVFPTWRVATGHAYDQLDSYYHNVYPTDDSVARQEAMDLYKKLGNGEPVGMLPNDFAPGLIERFPDYKNLFSLFEERGCQAWGITGSGGAAFAVISAGVFCSMPVIEDWPDWVSQVLSVKI